MPTYTYRCTQCSDAFDRWQKISDAALETCSYCHGKLNRVPYPVGVVFKGSGFYSTDSRASQQPLEASTTPATVKG